MKPDPKLIDSMAMRYRHDFGLLDQNQKDSIRTTMKQLWEEVVGLGFYKTEKTNTMNKIERAISDIKSHIKSLDRDILVLETERKSLDRDILVLETEREAFKKQLDTLEKIQDDRSIPHDETIPNIPTWDKSHPGGFSLSSEPDEVPYGSICFCNPTNGGSGICGCIMGNKMVPNPKKYGTGIWLTNITTDKGLLSSINIDMPNGNISTTDSK